MTSALGQGLNQRTWLNVYCTSSIDIPLEAKYSMNVIFSRPLPHPSTADRLLYCDDFGADTDSKSVVCVSVFSVA